MNKTEKNKLVERLIKSKMPDYGKWLPHEFWIDIILIN